MLQIASFAVRLLLLVPICLFIIWAFSSLYYVADLSTMSNLETFRWELETWNASDFDNYVRIPIKHTLSAILG